MKQYIWLNGFTSNIILILFTILVLGCNDDPTKPIAPPENNDIVPQTDIIWPSLADSPWPMHHHDPQSTGRSKYAGPKDGILSKKVPASNMDAGVSVGLSQTLYLSTDDPYIFYALDYSGNVKWKIEGINYQSTPLISVDGTIFCKQFDKIIAISKDGNILWNYNIAVRISGLSLAIDKEGNLYFTNFEGGTLYVIDNKGELLWKLEDDRLIDYIPTFSPDGNTLYLMGKDVSILAIDITTKKIKWTFGEQSLCLSPVIDSDGNIIIISSGDKGCFQTSDVIMYSINETGEINWSNSFANFNMPRNIEPTIDYNGNIYFGSDTLYSFTNSGKQRWKKELKDGFSVTSPLICDINNVIYIGTNNDITPLENKILAVNSDGNILWEIIVSGERDLGVSPALTEDGTLIYPTWRGQHLLIIN